MDTGQFDEVTRTLGSGGTRRALAQLLTGTVLTGFAARFNWVETTAKAKKKTANPRRDERRQPAGQTRDRLRGEASPKKKKKKKGPPPLPPGCRNCNDCQMCQDGRCVPDPELVGVRCAGSGAACGYCQGGRCTPSDRPRCEDGDCPRHGQCCPEQHQCSDKSCVPGNQCCDDEYECPPDGPCVKKDRCCPDEKRCVEPESPTGYSCIGLDGCCPDQKKCGGGCITKRACCQQDRPDCGPCGEVYCDALGFWHCNPKCCANQKTCPDGTCVGKKECCLGEKKCANGTCISIHACCPNQKPCPDTTCVDKTLCCFGEKKCPDGTCVNLNACCMGQTRCGGTCCSEGYECCQGHCYKIADGPWTACGEGACISTQVYQCCGGKVCWANSDCCGDGRCCPYPHRCCGTTCCFGTG